MGNRALQPNMWVGDTIQVQRGDIWQLGAHRLMCGDSTCAQDVNALFADEQFTLCFTSPPYSNQRTYDAGPFDWHAMMCGAFDQIIAHGTPDCHILVNLGLSHKDRHVDMYWLRWLLRCEDSGWPMFGWYVWDRLEGKPGEWNGKLAPAHEFVFHFNKKTRTARRWIATKGSKQNNHTGLFRYQNGDIKPLTSAHRFGQEYKIPDSVIRLHSEKRRGIHDNHPAVFPVALPEFMMRTWSQPGDIVYEPFNGSGTSIIAGENLQRRVYACEINPRYCELAIQRWQAHTGLSAVRMEAT